MPAGNFRTRLELNDIDPETDIRIPKRTNLIQKLNNFDLQTFAETETENLDRKDCVQNLYWIDDSTFLILYISYQNSAYLDNALFIEDKLGLIILREYDNVVAYFNSNGGPPKNLPELGLGKPVNSSLLRKLFRENDRSKLKRVSLLNSNVSSHSIRSKTISADSVKEVPLGPDDYLQVVSTAEGLSVERNNQGTHRRYVGFQRGRISDTSKYVRCLPYLEWLDYLQETISARTRPLRIFTRYAKRLDAIPDPEPKNILLDFLDHEAEFVTESFMGVPEGQNLTIDNCCQDVIDNQFILVANGIEAPCSIEYVTEKRTYLLKSPTLSHLYGKVNDEEGDLVETLNESQLFRIIPKASNAVYSRGEFYSSRIPLGAQFNENRFEFKRTIFPHPILRTASEEKGQSPQNRRIGWDSESLFGIIDRGRTQTSFGRMIHEVEALVCDDMGTEIADFILVDRQNDTERVIFIHAKASDTFHPYSASQLQIVCGQAVKNLGYISMYNEERPRNLNRWGDGWRSNGRIVDSRIRRGEGTPDQLWEKISSSIRNPNTDREVWIVLGNMFSKQQFINELAREIPTPEAVQFLYLLLGTQSQVAGVGAKLRIMCSG